MAEEAAAEDQETRTKIAFNLGEALEDPSPLFDLARAVEQALFVRERERREGSVLQECGTNSRGEHQAKRTLAKEGVGR